MTRSGSPRRSGDVKPAKRKAVTHAALRHPGMMKMGRMKVEADQEETSVYWSSPAALLPPLSYPLLGEGVFVPSSPLDFRSRESLLCFAFRAPLTPRAAGASVAGPAGG